MILSLISHSLSPTCSVSLTYSDVEAIDAEGGTPTFLKPLLLGVSFHCLSLSLFSPSLCQLAVKLRLRTLLAER